MFVNIINIMFLYVVNGETFYIDSKCGNICHRRGRKEESGKRGLNIFEGVEGVKYVWVYL